MRKVTDITTNAKQSSIVTDALQQYTRYTLNCWERTVAILRKEALDKDQPFAKRCPGGLNLKRICGIDFFRQIDDKHPERVADELLYIFEHPLVVKKKTYFGMALISLFVENPEKSGEYLIEFTPSVIQHYLANDLSVEYDANLVTSFTTSSAPILYKKACMLAYGADGYFEVTEDQIRLTFSIDTIDDLDHLKDKKIKDTSRLPIIYSDSYQRFDHLFTWLIQPGITEIESAYKDGKCPFYLTREINKRRKYTGKRGKPQYEYSVRFYIVDDAEDYAATDDVEVEDAVIIEELSPVPEPSQIRVPAIEAEIPFDYDESELTSSLQKFRDEISEIFRAAKATYTIRYIAQISAMVKERYGSYPTLPSAILAWIEYTRKIVEGDQQKKPVDLLRMVTSRIERYCHVYYANDKNIAKKRKLHAEDDLTPIFPLGALSLAEEKEIITKNSNFFAAVCKECELSDEAVKNSLESFYVDRKNNGDSYYETLDAVIAAFRDWLYPTSPAEVTESRKDAETTSTKSVQPKTKQGRWEGENAVVYDSVEAEVVALKADSDWRSVVLARFSFMRQDEKVLDEYLDKWGMEVSVSGKKHSCLGDAKDHFMKKMLIEDNKIYKNKNSNGTSNKPTMQQRIIEELAEAAEYFNGIGERRKASLHSGVSEEVW